MASNIIKNFYFRIPKQVKIFIAFAIAILVVYFLAYYFASDDVKQVPSEFLKARQEAATIAKEIVGLSNQTANNIPEISNLEKQIKYDDALNLLTTELDRNRQAREKAIDLSKQLEIMAKNISSIKPDSSSQIALKAVSSETALISRLIVYNDYLLKLLEALEKRILGSSNIDGEISELINKTNEEARAINNLDREFNNLMEEFDNQ